jgi:hypothetical protein
VSSARELRAAIPDIDASQTEGAPHPNEMTRVTGLISDYASDTCAFCGMRVPDGTNGRLELTVSKSGGGGRTSQLVAHWECLRERITDQLRLTVDLVLAPPD